MPAHPYTVVALVLPLVALAACRAVGERIFTPPDVDFRGVEVTGLTARGATLAIAVAVHNPNVYSLTARQGLYRLMVRDSIEVGRGLAAPPLTVAGKDSAVAQLPLEVTWSGLGAAGREILRGTIEYRLVGEIVVDTPVGSRSVPFDERGRFEAGTK